MSTFLQDILNSIGAGGQAVNDYFKRPENPYAVKSPIPNEQLVTRELPAGFKSPIPTILQHVQGQSAFQNTIDDTRNQVGTFMSGFNKQASVPRSTTSTPTPTPTQAPRETFADFTTAPVTPAYAPIITKAAIDANINPNLLASLLFSEHGFSTTPGFSYNSDGSYDRGPAQINSRAHPEISDAQALDPNFAIPWAANLLSSHIKKLGLKRGIIAYNMGATGSLRVADPTQTVYYQKVVSGLSPYLRQRMGL